MSAVGLASATAQVVELSGTVLVKLYHYYLDVKISVARSTELRNEVGLLLSLLNTFTGNLFDSSTCRFELMSAFEGLHSVLDEIDKRVTADTTKGLRKLEWPFKKDENERLLAKLERHKVILCLALNIEQRCNAIF